MIEELLLGVGVIGIILSFLYWHYCRLGLIGLVWWSFIIIFYLIIAGLLGLIAHI